MDLSFELDIAPMIIHASSEARNNAIRAISSARPKREAPQLPVERLCLRRSGIQIVRVA
jgi:hypothetical protein